MKRLLFISKNQSQKRKQAHENRSVLVETEECRYGLALHLVTEQGPSAHTYYHAEVPTE